MENLEQSLQVDLHQRFVEFILLKFSTDLIQGIYLIVFEELIKWRTLGDHVN